MSAIRTYLTLILLCSVTLSWGIDIDQLRQRKLHVKVIYTHASSVLLQKVQSFQKARKISTRLSSLDTQVRKAFCGIYHSRDVAFDLTSFRKDIENKRLLKRNRKAVLNRKILVPEPDFIINRAAYVHIPIEATDLLKTILTERSTLLNTGKSLLVFLSNFRN